METVTVNTPDLGRSVYLRPAGTPEGDSDCQVWADTFTGRYHLPPADMPHPGTVLDLGANIGLTAAHYKTLWPQAQVVAVELDSESANLAVLNAPNVAVRCQAVSAEGGWGSFRRAGRPEGYAFTAGGRTGEVVAASYTIRQLAHREFVTGHADFVKMDVEGEEWAIFAHSSWADCVSHLLVELHGGGGSEALVASAIDRLTSIGFNARHHPPHPQAVYAWRP